MTPRALVVEHDTKTLQLIDDVLTALEHDYQPVASLVDARKLLRTNGYSYILLACEIPSRPHDTPRIQNAENFLEALRRFKGADMPPVIVLLPPQEAYPDMTREESVRMAHGLMLRGATDFIAKPFATAGRTLDRVIKKVIGPLDVTKAPSRLVCKAPTVQEPHNNGDGTGWLTVTQAGELLMHDLPGLDLAKARSRISTAAGRKEFKFDGERKERRIDPHTFASWRLKQRDRDLDAEDEDEDKVA